MANIIYVIHMYSKNMKLLKRVESRRRKLGMTQVQLSARLDVNQGHISKVLCGKEPISAKMLEKLHVFLNTPVSQEQPNRELEDEIIAAVRSSESFLNLMRAALKMHKIGG